LSKVYCFYFLFGLAFICYAISACNSPNEDPPKSADYIAGELVAKRVCGSCHQYTAPDLLDAISWPNVMSAMKVIMKKEDQEPSYEDWIAVQRFYLNHSPRVFNSTKIKQPKEQHLFKTKRYKSDSLFHSRSTLLHHDEKSGQLIIGQQNGDYVMYDSVGYYESYNLPNVPIGYSEDYILGMGELGPSDDVNGTLYEIKESTYIPLVSWMNRAIYFEHVDLNNNGNDEFVICSFGSQSGGLMTGELVLAYRDKDEIIKTTLDSLPGATMTMTYDLDNDGLLDVVSDFIE